MGRDLPFGPWWFLALTAPDEPEDPDAGEDRGQDPEGDPAPRCRFLRSWEAAAAAAPITTAVVLTPASVVAGVVTVWVGTTTWVWVSGVGLDL